MINTSQPLNPPPLPQGSDSTSAATIPIEGFGSLIEAVLRHPASLVEPGNKIGHGMLLGGLCGMILGGALIYGFVMGTFTGGDQLWAVPLKVAAGLTLSALICLPSLYILSCLEGSPARLRDVARVLAGLTALSTLLLLGFAPVAWVFSQSTQSVVAMGTVHLVFWWVATIFGLRFLRAAFRRWNPAGNPGLKVWMIIYLLVCLQMSTALRPLIGPAASLLPTEKKFFITHWIDSMKEKSIKTPAPDGR